MTLLLSCCRFSHDAAVWACLAALSMAAGELATAEVAFAAIDAVDKLQYVLRLKSLAGSGAATASGADPLVAAELALYTGQPDEAEAKLLQVGEHCWIPLTGRNRKQSRKHITVKVARCSLWQLVSAKGIHKEQHSWHGSI